MNRPDEEDDSGIRERVSASVRLSLTTEDGDTGKPRRLGAGSANYTCIERISAPMDALFAGRSDGGVIMWRVPNTRIGSFRDHVVLGSHKGSVASIAFQAHHHVLVTGSSDFTIKLWDAVGGETGGKCVQTIPAHDATVTALASHCNVVISGSADKTVKLWRFDPDRAKLCFPWMEVKQVFVLDTWATALWASATKVTESSQGEVFVGDGNGNITVLRSELESSGNVDNANVGSLQLVRRIEGDRKQSIARVMPIPNLNLVVTITFDDKARIRDVIGFQTLVTIDHPDAKRFIDVAWSAAHEELLLLDTAGDMFVWSTRSNKILLKQHIGPKASQLLFAKGLAWVAQRDSIDAIIIERTTTFAEYAGHTDRVISVGRISSDAMELPVHWVSASADNTIAFWSKQIECLYTMREKQSEIVSFVVLTSAPWFVTGHDNGTLKFWSLGKDTTFRFAAHDNTVSVVGEGFHRTVRGCITEDWPHLFTGSYDGCFAIWEMPSEGNKAKCEARVRVSTSEVLSAVYDPLRKAYIVGTNDGDITIWSTDELKPVMRLRSANGPKLPAHSGAVTCLALDGNIAFSGGEDEAVLLWNMATGELTKELVFRSNDELGDIQSFRVLPTTGNLLVATRNGNLVVFDQSTGESQWSHSLGREVSSAHFDKTSQEILAGLADGAVIRLVAGDLDAPGTASGAPDLSASALPEAAESAPAADGIDVS
jgi:WD40 repeat protein